MNLLYEAPPVRGFQKRVTASRQLVCGAIVGPPSGAQKRSPAAAFFSAKAKSNVRCSSRVPAALVALSIKPLTVPRATEVRRRPLCADHSKSREEKTVNPTDTAIVARTLGSGTVDGGRPTPSPNHSLRLGATALYECRGRALGA